MGGSLMTRHAAWRLDLFREPGAVRRGLLAGTAWGIATGLTVTAAGAWECGGICLPDAALTLAISVTAGLGTIGPLAAFGVRPDRDATAIAQPGRALS